MKKLLFLGALLCTCWSCSSGDSSARGNAAATGAVVGAGAGAIAGSTVDHPGAGAAIGAASGAVAGSLLVEREDAFKDKVKQQQEIIRLQNLERDRQRREKLELERQKLMNDSLRRYEE